MKCGDVVEQLSPFLDDELGGQERSELDKHVSSCEACAKELASLRSTVDLLHSLPRASAPAALAANVARAIREPRPVAERYPVIRVLWPALAAAAVAFVVYVAFPADSRPDKPVGGGPVAVSDDDKASVHSAVLPSRGQVTDSVPTIRSDAPVADGTAPYARVSLKVTVNSVAADRPRIERILRNSGIRVLPASTKEGSADTIQTRCLAKQRRGLLYLISRAGYRIEPANPFEKVGGKGPVDVSIRLLPGNAAATGP